jgi:hypothetical protein
MMQKVNDDNNLNPEGVKEIGDFFSKIKEQY